jgi:hypothetical protein
LAGGVSRAGLPAVRWALGVALAAIVLSSSSIRCAAATVAPSGLPPLKSLSWSRVHVSHGVITRIGGVRLPFEIQLPLGISPLGHEAMVAQFVKPKGAVVTIYFAMENSRKLQTYFESGHATNAFVGAGVRPKSPGQFYQGRPSWIYQSTSTFSHGSAHYLVAINGANPDPHYPKSDPAEALYRATVSPSAPSFASSAAIVMIVDFGYAVADN